MAATILPIDEIHLNDDNPRLIKDERFKQLVKSIQDFPEMLMLRPIVVDETTTVLGGNMRLRALQHLCYTEVPVVVAAGLNDEQKREFIIKDNGSFGDWDWDALANGEWPDAATLNSWGVDVPKDWGAIEVLPAEEDDFAAAGLAPLVANGDLFQLGEHRLLCGDAMDTEAIALLLNSGKADLVLTDPPYDLPNEWVTGLLPFCRKHWLIMAGDRQQADLAQRVGEYFNQYFVLYFRRFSWNLNKYIPLLTHVLTAHFKLEEATNYDLEGMHSLVEHACKTDDDQPHKHAKDVGYMADFIKVFSRPNDLVIDLFGGSGTNLIASQQQGRRCCQMELDETNCEHIIRRWAAYCREQSKEANFKHLNGALTLDKIQANVELVA